MFRNSTKGSFSADLKNSSMKIYHQENDSLWIVKGFCLSKAVGPSLVLTFCSPSLFVTGLTLQGRFIQLGISSLRTLLLRKKNFLSRFDFYRVLSVRTCDVDSSIAIAESLGYSKSLSSLFFILLT